MSPDSNAILRSCAVLWTPSFIFMLARWASTVLMLICNRWLISRLLMPRQINSRICRSRPVSAGRPSTIRMVSFTPYRYSALGITMLFGINAIPYSANPETHSLQERYCLFR